MTDCLEAVPSPLLLRFSLCSHLRWVVSGKVVTRWLSSGVHHVHCGIGPAIAYCFRCRHVRIPAASVYATRPFHLALLLRSRCYACSVFACKNRATGEVCAAKVVEKKRFRLIPSFNMESLFREADILMALRHPNIIRVLDLFNEDDDVVIITEYAQGGELFDTLVEHGNFSEACVRTIMWQAMDAVAYLHRNNIVHRYSYRC